MFGILTFGIFRPFALLSFREDTSFTDPIYCTPRQSSFLVRMAFYGMGFGEKTLLHPPMKPRGVDARYYGSVSHARRGPVPNTSSSTPRVQSAPAQAAIPTQRPDSRSYVSQAALPAQRRLDPSNFKDGMRAPPHGSSSVPPGAVSSGAMVVPTTHEAQSLFKRFDYNGNGKLSLAEIDRAVGEIWPHYHNKKAVLRAYRASDVDGDGFVSSQEFSLFLKYLARFNDLWMAYESIDTNKDGRLTCEEFVRGKSVFGLGGRSAREVQQLFNAVDTNRGGYILFDELANYVCGAELNAERQLLKTQLKRPVRVSIPEEKQDFLEMPSLPRERDLFSRLDMNRNNMLSLAELDKAVVELWPRFNNKPALMRAYKAADLNGNGFLGRREFKFFLTFLVVYTNLFQRFQSMDTNGDRRLSLEEFLTAKANANRSEAELRSIFASLDTNHGGYILFDEFCEFEAQRTLAELLDQQSKNPQDAVSAFVPCIPGLMCVYCGRTVPELDQHLPVCRSEHIRVLQSLPEFLRISLPEMPLSIPTLQSQVKLYNETARRLHDGLSIVECPECGRKFPLNRFGGHIRTHSISYDRRMQLMKRPGKGMADVALPVAVDRMDRSEAVRRLRMSLVNGFDVSALSVLRRQLFLHSKQCSQMNASELQKILGSCGLTGNRTVSLKSCSELLGTFDSEERANSADLLHALDIPLPSRRDAAVRETFSRLDRENTQMIPFRIFRDSLEHSGLIGILTRPPERVVTFREFEQVARDLSDVFLDDSDFISLFRIRTAAISSGASSFNVLATLTSGAKHVVRIDVPEGSLVRKDPKSLIRRLTLLGIEDVVRAELM